MDSIHWIASGSASRAESSSRKQCSSSGWWIFLPAMIGCSADAGNSMTGRVAADSDLQRRAWIGDAVVVHQHGSGSADFRETGARGRKSRLSASAG